MFCSSCGKENASSASFCGFCGAPLTPQANARQASAYGSGIMPGFSDRVNDPSLKLAMSKGKKATAIFSAVLILAPAVISLILSINDSGSSYFGIGAALSAFFLAINLISAAKKKSEKQWDGVVTDKSTRRAHSKGSGESADYYTQYIVSFRDDSGKARTLKEGTANNSAHPYYDYLNIGDRVRFHPTLNSYYEKYDKSRDSYVLCAVCGKANDIIADSCAGCGTILIK